MASLINLNINVENLPKEKFVKGKKGVYYNLTISVNDDGAACDINGFTIDWRLREVKRDGVDLHLTKTAFNILEFLYQHQNKCCSRDEILDKVWGKDIYVDNRTVDNFVSQLKKQLNLSGEQPTQIKTIRGIGYSLVR